MDQIDRSKAKADLYKWKPKNESEVICTWQPQKFIIRFDEAFKNKNLEKYNIFFIKKTKFDEYLELFSSYINYFIHKYDTENEVVMGYLKIKHSIDVKKEFNADNVGALIDLIYEMIFTPEVCEKIRQFVDDNYLDDIEKESDYASEINYRESLEFKNQHIKILLRISFGMKIIYPIMLHFFAVTGLKPKEIKSINDISIVYDFYIKLFTLFSDNVNMMNKLFVYIKSKVVDGEYHNRKIFDQRAIYGEDQALIIERFLKKQLISENMVKYKFNRTWNPKKKKYDENIIGFNKTVIGYQLKFFRKEIYARTLTEMTNSRDSEGLSSSDKMEMKMSKIDQGALDMSTVNVETTIERLKRDINVPIDDREIAYYRKYHYPSDIQTHLVRSIYAQYFMSYRDEYIIDRYQYNNLLLILKKKLLLEAGYMPDATETGCILPYILTGNISGKINRRLIRDRKFMNKLEEDETYQYLIHVKYKELEEEHPGWIKELISTFINTQFTYVCYEQPEILNKPIIASEEKISSELLFFLKNI